ncbi:hypothetical protein [Streptomyces sp. NPDC005799]|uniref:hypothetical protein n=1 Tax=Streptomyces sp. NPDC005799 TaxID=3154678 RepID=UPI0033F00DDA
MCLNRKTFIPVAVIAAGLIVLPPSWDLAAVPFLLMLVCPLTVLVIMREQGSEAGDGDARTARQTSDADRLSDQAIDRRIRELQAELRELKAEQARRAEAEETGTSYGGSGSDGLDKPGPPAPRS